MANQGMYGSETRTEVKNPLEQNRGQASQPNSIPLPGVSSPRGADFSQIGESSRVISKLLGQGAGLMDKYVEEKRTQWELDGKMAYAQGVSEEEIYKSGNKYTTQGYMSMKAVTGLQTLYQQSLQEIADGDYKLSPEEYRAKTNKSVQELYKSLPDDPAIHNIVTAGLYEYTPKLAAQQLQSNNKYRQEETYNSFVQLGESTAQLNDPQGEDEATTNQRLRDLLRPETSGLPEELHKKAVAEILKRTLDAGNSRVANSLAGLDQKGSGIQVKELPPTQQVADATVSTILKNELHADGIIRVHEDGDGKAIGGINSVAYPEQFAEASQILRDNGQTAALMYIRDFYRKEIVEKNGISNLSADVQDVVADGLTNHWSGFQTELLNAAKAGKSRDELLAMRRTEYERLVKADPAKYGPAMQGWMSRLDKLQSDGNRSGAIQSNAQGFLTEQKLRMTLSHNGFDMAEINSVMASYNKMSSAKDSEFDKQRYLNEDKIIQASLTEGNLSKQLDAIKSVQEMYGYSEKWANDMAGKAATKVEEYNKKEREFQQIDTAVANGTLGLEDSSKQRIGIDRLRASIIGRVSAMPDLTNDQKEALIRSDMTNALVKNGVTDPIWERSIKLGLTGEIVTPSGNLNPAALKAYSDIQYLRKNAPSGYAEQYLSGDTAKLVAQAETFDATMNSDQALIAAHNIQLNNKKDAGTPTTSRADDLSGVEAIVAGKVSEELDTGFLASFSRSSATTFLDVTDEDIALAKSDPALLAYMTILTRNELMKPANKHTTPHAAANEAWSKIAKGSIELTPGGSVLIPPNDGGGSIRARIGAPNAGATNFVYKVLQLYQAENGKRLFGPRYNASVSYNTKEQVDKYKSENPNADFGPSSGSNLYPARQKSSWRATSRGLEWELMTQTKDGSWIGDGDFKVIPYDELNEFRKTKRADLN